MVRIYTNEQEEKASVKMLLSGTFLYLIDYLELIGMSDLEHEILK